MDGALLDAFAAGPWAIPLLFLLVFGDAFLVVVPGEAAVTAFGALAVSTGSPPLAAVIAAAAVAAACGDVACYAIGRRVGVDRWRWMRARRVQAAIGWARDRLHRSTATALFTARFIPFARLAVNLTAGATRVPAPRYVAMVAVAASVWAAYQALLGALVASVLPGGTLTAVLVSIAVGLITGFAVDGVLAARRRRAARS